MNTIIKKLLVKKDKRGSFFEILRQEDVGIKDFGQIYITTAKPRQIKGNHYHTRKKEWFCVIKGMGVLTLINKDTKKTKRIKMSQEELKVVEILPNIIHKIENTGKREMVLLAYISESYNPDDPDTFFIN